MPFEAAKAVAATFCWKIRYALTPLFGLDFPSLCVPLEDRARFGRMIIDPAIVQQATEKANTYRMLELQSSPTSLLRATASYPSPSPAATDIGLGMGIGIGMGKGKQILLPKTATSSSSAKRTCLDNLSSSGSSGYDSSPEQSDSYCVSPASPYRNSFTPVNTPRSSGPADSGSGVNSVVPSPQEVLARISLMSDKVGRNGETDADADAEADSDEGSSDSSTASTLYSDFTNTNTNTNTDAGIDSPTDSLLSMDLDNDNDSEDYGTGSPSPSRRRRIGPRLHRGPNSVLFAREVKAAHALLSLHMQNVTTSASVSVSASASASVKDGDRDGRGNNEHGDGSSPSTSSWYYRYRLPGSGSGLGSEGRGRKRRRASA